MTFNIDPNLSLDELLKLFDEAVAAFDRERALAIEALILKRIAERQADDEALELELREKIESLKDTKTIPVGKPDAGLLDLELGEKKMGDESKVYPVWFGTNRKPTIDGKAFTSERHSTISRGRVDVRIPESHKFGETGSSFFKRLRRFELKDDSLKIQRIKPQDQEEFYADIQQQMQEASKDGKSPDALVYLHGYRNSFEDAAIRAAQIGFDLGVSGATAFFSWPSRGNVRGYTVDEASIAASEWAITDFLVEFSAHCDSDKIHIIAHSMGNRGLLRALQRIAGNAATKGKVKFGQIFLAAADVDRDLFLDLADLYPTHSERTTLYASDGDRAVMASSKLHDAPRAGYYEPHTFAIDIDSILVPDFDIDLLGHSYFAQAEALLYDMAELMKSNTPPGDRIRIDGPLSGIDSLWKIKK